MNHTLLAQVTKISWQLDTINHEIDLCKAQLLKLKQQFKETQASLDESLTNTVTGRIHLEQEIAKLNFIKITQETLQILIHEEKEALRVHAQLTTTKIHLDTQLKTLEKLQDKQEQRKDKLNRIKQQNELDEWVLHKRDRKCR